MKTPILHEKSKEALERMWRGDAHAMLLSGPVGVGLAAAATFVSASAGVVLWVRPEKEGSIDYEKGSISVDQIRELYDTVKTVDRTGRVVIIDAAERMAHPAQNAFLKLLEEPPRGVRFMLLSHTPSTLLPTVRSRTQEVALLPVSRRQSEALLDDLRVMDATKRTQLLFIAEGLPAELHRLASDDERFAVRAGIVRDARAFISGSVYERFLVAQKYKDSKVRALQLLDDALKQLHDTLRQSGDATLLERIAKLIAAHDSITQNGTVRLQLAATIVL